MSSRSRQPPGDGAAEVQRIARLAVAEVSEGLDADRLTDFVEALLQLAGSPRRLGREVVAKCEVVGRHAAFDGVGLPSLVDGFLSASRIVWVRSMEHPSPRHGAGRSDARAVGEAIFRATDTALAAVARGFGSARVSMVRREESERRELIDDLLGGTADTAGLVSRAERFGLQLTAPHSVLIAVAGRPFRESSSMLVDFETRLRVLLPGRSVLLATKHGSLVVVLGEGAGAGVVVSEDERVLKALLRSIRRGLHSEESVRLSAGPVRHGPNGISESFRAARRGAEIAARLEWDDRIVRPGQVAVYDVLLRDRHALTALVESVLAPLSEARGGAAPLVGTLLAYLGCGAVATETARQMNLSVRAVTYRLARVKNLTGWDPTNPAHWLTLQTAAQGARLLGWPDGDPVDVAGGRQQWPENSAEDSRSG